TAWQRLRHVTLPLLRPFLALAMFLSFTTAFADLANVWMLTGGRVIFPVIGTYAYWLGIRNGAIGEAAAWSLSLVPLLAAALVAPAALRDLRRAEHDPLHPDLPGRAPARARRHAERAGADLLGDGAAVLRLGAVGLLSPPAPRDRGVRARGRRLATHRVRSHHAAVEPQRPRGGRPLHAGHRP